MRIGLVGPSYVMRSLPFDAQRTINLYPIADPEGKETASLFGTPGLSLLATFGNGAGRKLFASSNGRAFAAIGSKLYEIDSFGNETLRGSLNQNSGNLSVAENSTQMAICDGTSLYIFNYAANTLSVITSGLPASVGFVTAIDGYFIVLENNSGRFYVSALNDGTSWNALDFATAESNPDQLLCVANSSGQLYLLGTRTFEIWTNTGNAAFPFQRISGAVGDIGIIAPHTALDVDNSLVWLGQDKNGRCMVYRAKGLRPQRISTEAIEIVLQSATDPELLKAFAYQQDGHLFYIITGGGLETSLCFDVTTGLWHERAYLNELGEFEPHLAADVVYAFEKHIALDRRNGKLYELKLDVYSDNGEPIVRERTYTHLSDEGREIRFNRLELSMETGVGLQTGQGVNPLVSLQLSKDGARTWSDWHDATFGAAGKYLTKVVFRRLGIADQMTFRIRITDPVKVSIIGSYLQ